MHDNIKVLCIGDLMGLPGRALFKKHSALLRKKYSVDAIIVNGENSASDGRGITPPIVDFLKKSLCISSKLFILVKFNLYKMTRL